MAKIRDVLFHLERIAPHRYTFPFDKVGLQVGEENAEVSAAAVSLDRSLGAIEFAKSEGCQLLVSHHPLIFTPLETVTDRSHTSRSALKLAHSGIGFIAVHTNWDSAIGGINDVLAKILGLNSVRAFGTGAMVTNHKLVFFCPFDSTDAVIEKVAETGAGVIGAYKHCSFRTPGVGTFIGSSESHPAVGEPGQLESVEEYRVEMLLPPGTEKSAERALLKAHPYETPAFDIYALQERIEQPAGRIGELSEPVSFGDFMQSLDGLLDTRSYAWGSSSKKIRKVAIVGGAADGEWIHAQKAGADVLVTGEVRQHIAVEASECGLCVTAAGHYATEHPGSAELLVRLKGVLPEIDWKLFVPPAGLHGRPFHV